MSNDKQPTDPAVANLSQIQAMQAMHKGDASPEQQQKALKWILEDASKINDICFYAGDSNASAFAAGKRFVGMQILSLIDVNTAKLEKGTNNE